MKRSFKGNGETEKKVGTWEITKDVEETRVRNRRCDGENRNEYLLYEKSRRFIKKVFNRVELNPSVLPFITRIKHLLR